MAQNFDIPLHDIKPIVEIQEYSMEYLIGFNIAIIALVVGIIYLIVRLIQSRRAFNIRREHKRLIDELSLDDTKNAAYRLSEYGITFRDDTLRHSKAYEELLDALEPYKYKKSVTAFSEDTLHFIEIYRGMIDE